MAQLIADPREVARGHHELAFAWDGAAPLPGQFISIKVNEGSDPLIRRPFSVYDFREGVLRIVVKSVGRGTRELSRYAKGDALDVLGPLGRGFSVREGGSVLLVGGGVGNAPLYFLARALVAKGTAVTCVYGSRDAGQVYLSHEFLEVCDRLVITTDDGSAGQQGTVADLLPGVLDGGAFDMICTCGPALMMKAVTEIAVSRKVPVEVSLENYFGCGVGLCYGCTVDTVNGNRRACVDGPVMDGSVIRWDSLD